MKSHAPWLVVASALGGCYLSHEQDVEGPSCVPEPVARCDAWESAGDPVRLSAPADPADSVQLADVVAIDDCSFLVGWTVVTSRLRFTLRHHTRLVARDGRPLAPIVDQTSVTRDAGGWSRTLLTRAGGRVLMRVYADGCFLLPLDLEGHELGPPVELAPGELCRSLESAGDGFSLVLSGFDGGAPLSLAFVDADGRLTSRADLPPPGDGRSWWSRTVFEDGSFLSYTKTQDLATGRYEGWLQPFTAAGAPLGEPVPLGENGVPVHVAPTSEGALALWMTADSGGLPLRLRPIDRLGRARGETRDVEAEGALYGALIRALPDGGALLAWEESHFDAGPMWRLRVQSLSADGSPRGAPSTVRTVGHAEAWDLLVDPSGARALLVTSSDGRDVDAQPLRCAR